jgi:hypothetical protein
VKGGGVQVARRLADDDEQVTPGEGRRSDVAEPEAEPNQVVLGGLRVVVEEREQREEFQVGDAEDSVEELLSETSWKAPC